MYWIKVIIVTILVAGMGFLIHVFYGQGLAMEYVQKAAENGRLNDVIRQPYSTFIVVIAFFTALLPAFGKVFTYILIQDKLPSENKIIKGILFGLLLLFIGDNLFRTPIMGVVVGNPLDVIFVQSAEKWIIYLLTGVFIALLAPKKIFSFK